MPDSVSPCVSDLGEYGAGLVEAGVRDFGDWSKQMRSDFPTNKFTDGDLQRVWNESRMHYAQKLAENGNQIVRPTSAIFIDHAARIMGRPGAAKFIGELAEPDGSNPLFDKIAGGKDLTPEETARAAKAWAGGLQEKANRTMNPKPSVRPLQEIMDAARALKASGVIGKPHVGPKMSLPVRAVMDVVRGKYGSDAATRLRTALAENGKDVILNKIATRQPLTDAERMKATQAFSDAARYKPPSDAELSDAARQVKETAATARDTAREELSSARTFDDVMREWGYKNLKGDDGKPDKAKINAYLADVAKVAPNDFAGYAKVMAQHSRQSVAQSWFALWRAGLLSNPLIVPKIVSSQLAHFALSELARAPGSVFDRATARSTGRRGLLGASAGDFGRALRLGSAQGVAGARIMAREGQRRTARTRHGCRRL